MSIIGLVYDESGPTNWDFDEQYKYRVAWEAEDFVDRDIVALYPIDGEKLLAIYESITLAFTPFSARTLHEKIWYHCADRNAIMIMFAIAVSKAMYSKGGEKGKEVKET